MPDHQSKLAMSERSGHPPRRYVANTDPDSISCNLTPEAHEAVLAHEELSRIANNPSATIAAIFICFKNVDLELRSALLRLEEAGRKVAEDAVWGVDTLEEVHRYEERREVILRKKRIETVKANFALVQEKSAVKRKVQEMDDGLKRKQRTDMETEWPDEVAEDSACSERVQQEWHLPPN